jgi:hypothetical protein
VGYRRRFAMHCCSFFLGACSRRLALPELHAKPGWHLRAWCGTS